MKKDQTHLEETVEGLGLAFVWLVKKLEINEDDLRAGIAKLREEDAVREEQLVRDLSRDIGGVLDPLMVGPTLDGEAMHPDPVKRREQIRAVVMGDPVPHSETRADLLQRQLIQLQAMRACIVYARDRRGHHFDFDAWIAMVESALGAGIVPPNALEDAQSEALLVTKVLDKVRAERDELKKALQGSNALMAAMGTNHWPRVAKNEFKSYQLVGCKCGFDTTSEDELIKHMATQQVLQNLPDADWHGAHCPYANTRIASDNPSDCTCATDKMVGAAMIHETYGKHPKGSLELLDEGDHWRIRVREIEKASIFLTDKEIDRLEKEIAYMKAQKLARTRRR